MLTVPEAIAAIIAEVQPLPCAAVPLGDALGLVLAEDVHAEFDSPPFDKAMMDGYAVRTADLPEGRGTLQVIEEVSAGRVPEKQVTAGCATRIMTGAPVPHGADAVVPVENTKVADNGDVAIHAGLLRSGQNILPRGTSTRAGTLVVKQGARLRPQELGCLAELGKARASAYRRARVAVLATGDELVPIEFTPAPGQIRNSNEAMLAAQIQRLGATPVSLGIARDNVDDLHTHIREGLKCDMLLLSGGVSAGKFDLVPAVLAELGVRQVFHKVRIRPGQPLWFGISGAPQAAGDRAPPGSRSIPVFGLPGNPVSSMVCCELFAGTALRRLMGFEAAAPAPIQARLAREHRSGGNRPTYHPAHVEWTSTGAQVDPVAWVGSADLSATVAANAMALFPEGDRVWEAGSLLDVYPW